MERESVINDIKTFLTKLDLLEDISFIEIEQYDLVIVKCSLKIWDLVYNQSLVVSFGDLPRDIKDKVIDKHPEIITAFEEECEEFEKIMKNMVFPIE